MSSPQHIAHAPLDHRIARRLLVMGALVAAAFTVLHFAWPVPGSRQPWAALTNGALALWCAFAAWRICEHNWYPLTLATAWLAVLEIVSSSVELGEGVLGIGLAFCAVVVCLVCVLASRRDGLLLAAASAAAIVAVAFAQTRGWGFAAPLPWSALQLPLVSQLLLIGTGAAGGAFVASVVARHAAEADNRERRFRSLLDIAADWTWEQDAEFRFTALSPSVGSGSGIDATEHLGKRRWELPELSVSPEAWDAHRADLEAHRPFRNFVMHRPGRDGRRSQWVSISGEPRFDAAGRFVGYWGVGRNITSEVRARLAGAASESRYRELFNRSPSPLVLHRAGIVIDANPAALQLFGYPDLKSIVGQDLRAHFADDESRARSAERVAQLESLPIGQSLPYTEFTLRSRDGRRVEVRATGVRVGANGGTATMSIYTDETERRAAEDAMRRSQALLAQLVEMSPDVITLTEMPSGRYTMVNKTFSQVTGWSRDEAIGRTPLELGIWRDPGDRERLVGLLSQHGAVDGHPVVLIAKDGHEVPLLVSAARFSVEGRDYIVTNARDVSAVERTRLEREAMFENASIGIAFTRDRAFVQANPRFEQMFGWARGTLSGQPGRVVWPSDEAYAEIGASFGARLAQGLPVEFEREMRRRDGSTFWCRMLAKAVDPTHPSKGGTVWICEDVTERRRFEHALAQARDAAEAASRAKSAFLANTSHELRTPLNGLLGLARLVQRGELDAQHQRQYIDQIVESAQALTDIITDILDLSKIEAGKLTLETVPFDLRETVSALHRAYRSIAQARGLEFTLQIDPDVPAVVTGDPVRTRQILSNYVNNALKFTTAGTVHVSAARTGDERIRLAVRDTGPGIDEATRARLFHPFTQADDSTTRRYGGTGLGLSICRQLAELMGGEVGVESAPGQGSLFWAELPLPATDEDTPVSGFGALEAAPLARTRVLVVEDNPVNMLICVALLEQHGVRVAQATSGEAAIAAVERAQREGDPFDVVLMDVQMPGMSGHEATRILRRRYSAAQLPIIALTAAALVSEREQALAAGMNDFLTKPSEPHHLLRALARALA